MTTERLLKRATRLLQEQRLTIDSLAECLKVSREEAAGLVGELAHRKVDFDIRGDGSDPSYHITVLPSAGNIYHLTPPDTRDSPAGGRTFALTSDWHFGSKFHLARTWHGAMRLTADAGITRVLVAGDVVDGYGVYKGQLENLVSYSVEDQTDMVAEAVNKHPSLQFYAIGGNHDFSFTKQNGIRPGALIAAKAKNFFDLGDFRADLHDAGLRLRMLHGGSGRTYAKSYPAQTYLREHFSGSDHEDLRTMPHVYLIGHYHTILLMKDHGAWIVQPGSFQDGDNEYCIRRGLSGPNGLWHVNLDYGKGDVTRFNAEYVTPNERRTEKGHQHAETIRRKR